MVNYENEDAKMINFNLNKNLQLWGTFKWDRAKKILLRVIIDDFAELDSKFHILVKYINIMKLFLLVEYLYVKDNHFHKFTLLKFNSGEW